MHFVFRAVTKKGHRPFSGEVLQEAKGELLAMVLDSAVPLVDRAAFAQLL